MATTMYCSDNNNRFPDRGINSGSSEPMWARWAMRMQISSTDLRLDDALDKYMDTASAVWCCPLYKGNTEYAYNGGTCSSGHVARSLWVSGRGRLACRS